MKFIDLYAGLGGFHQALSKLGHKGVWASEYNSNLRDLYSKNFPGTHIEGDIFKVDVDKIPDHDIICGGFPCQPFSRAGLMKGFEDESKGNHFFRILDIIDSKKKINKAPKYIFLENVETVLKHDNKNTFKVISESLNDRGYDIDSRILSPHQFNIPHHRRRLFIVGILKEKGGLKEFKFPEPLDLKNTNIESILDFNLIPMDGENLYLNELTKSVINLWQDFVENFPKEKKLPGFPIWAHEWNATYPYETTTPNSASLSELKKGQGTFGVKITGRDRTKIIKNFIPRYAQKGGEFPKWKINYIRKNREFYNENKSYIDDFLIRHTEIYDFDFSYQKLEWSCQGAPRVFDDKILQFRPSGLRVKLNNWTPALTTVRTQNVYIPKLGRKLSLHEIAKLQSMSLENLPDVIDGKYVPNGGYKAFGNAVNVEVVKLIAKNLLK
ncbi:DNA (cytosine-5-)-methyltransferase [Flavobacteriales bacterium]|nr:DNA (cytosine-5-)-methyltransferase [Flavobacteriales bacterium]